MEYSVIVPAHNEGEHIVAFVSTFIQSLPEHVGGLLKEIILVENGSTDNTLAECKKLEQKYPAVVKAIQIGRGSYGEAIRTGMQHSSGTHLSILECDFLVPDFVAQSVKIFESSDVEFIIASKQHPDSKDERPFKRRMLTFWFNKILNFMVGYPGSDTHGLKSIETPLAKKLCELSQTTDEIFQTEIVVIAWALGHKIKEVPIDIAEKRAATVSIVKRLPKVMSMVFEIRKSLKRFR